MGLFSYSLQFRPIAFADDIFFCEGTIIQATTLILKGFAISTICPRSDRETMDCVTNASGLASSFLLREEISLILWGTDRFKDRKESYFLLCKIFSTSLGFKSDPCGPSEA